MKSLMNVLFGTACALVFTATAASAEIVCNRENECWHVNGHHDYHSEWGLFVHPDSWKWAEHEKYKWREHAGRGYWHNGVWIEF